MRIERTTALLAIALTAACAPSHFRADAGAAFTRVQGEMGLQNSAGNLNIAGNMNDVKDQLGAGDDEVSPYVRLEADWGPHRVKLSGLANNSAGPGTLAGAFGDLPAGTQVFTDFDFVNATAAWSYDLMPTPMFRIAPGVQLGYYSLDITSRAQTLSAFENVDTDFLTPMPYVEAEIDFDVIAIGANAGFLGVDLRDASGRYWDVEAYVRGAPFGGLELIGGLRYMLFDAHGEATGRDFDADLDVFGWFLAGGIRF